MTEQQLVDLRDSDFDDEKTAYILALKNEYSSRLQEIESRIREHTKNAGENELARSHYLLRQINNIEDKLDNIPYPTGKSQTVTKYYFFGVIIISKSIYREIIGKSVLKRTTSYNVLGIPLYDEIVIRENASETTINRTLTYRIFGSLVVLNHKTTTQIARTTP